MEVPDPPEELLSAGEEVVGGDADHPPPCVFKQFPPMDVVPEPVALGPVEVALVFVQQSRAGVREVRVKRQAPVIDDDGVSDERLGKPRFDDREAEERLGTGVDAGPDACCGPSERSCPASSSVLEGRLPEIGDGREHIGPIRPRPHAGHDAVPDGDEFLLWQDIRERTPGVECGGHRVPMGEGDDGLGSQAMADDATRSGRRRPVACTDMELRRGGDPGWEGQVEEQGRGDVAEDPRASEERFVRTAPSVHGVEIDVNRPHAAMRGREIPAPQTSDRLAVQSDVVGRERTADEMRGQRSRGSHPLTLAMWRTPGPMLSTAARESAVAVLIRTG